jgi:hypothetical protein
MAATKISRKMNARNVSVKLDVPEEVPPEELPPEELPLELGRS